MQWKPLFKIPAYAPAATLPLPLNIINAEAILPVYTDDTVP